MTRFAIPFGMVLLLAGGSFHQPPQILHAAQKEKVPKPRQLDKGVVLSRDHATTELNVLLPAEKSPAAAGSPPVVPQVVGRAFARLVPVTCSVSSASAEPVPGLTRSDFRVFDDNVEKEIIFFDAPTAERAGVALIIDASPSVLRDAKEMTDAARALMDVLSRNDEVAIVDFSAHVYLQSGFSGDRDLLSRAIARVDVRSLLRDVGGSNIYEAVYLTAHELFAKSVGRHHSRNAIVLFTDGQDSGLGLTLDPASAAAPHAAGTNAATNGAANRLTYEDVIRALTANDIQVFAISTETRPKILAPQWFEAHRTATLINADARSSGIPPYTLYLAELARRTGGQLYFLHEAQSLADTFQQIGQRVNAEYWLGFTPGSGEPAAAPSAAAEGPHAGWHSLRVEVAGHLGATATCRPSYFVPAAGSTP